MNNRYKSVWIRVSKKAPCRICKKLDWCGFTEDGGACCMRVISDKPMKNGGWFHNSGYAPKPYIPPVKPKPVQDIDFWALLKSWTKTTNPQDLIAHSEALGVEPTAFYSIGACWASSQKAWAFPMKDETSKAIGIRLRNEKGEKWAIKGSRQGLFYGDLNSKKAYIVEGVTDTAAMISLGLTAIGRPSCLGCEDMINQTLRANKIGSVVIVADNDEAGLRGATKLQSQLKIPSQLWIPPCKDIREFICLGGTKEILESSTKDLVWNT